MDTKDTNGAAFGVHDYGNRATMENRVCELEGHGDDKDSRSSSLGTDGSRLSDEWRELSPEMHSALTRLASRLCGACQRLCQGETMVKIYEDASRWEQMGELDYHPSLSSLSESVHAGCPLCNEISDSFKERLDTYYDVRESVTDSWHISCSLRGTFELPPWSKGLCFRFSLYDSNGQSVNHQIGGAIYKWFYPAERLGLGPEYQGERNIKVKKLLARINEFGVCPRGHGNDPRPEPCTRAILVGQVFE